MITFNHVLWNYGIIKPSRYVCKMPSDNISPWPRSRQPSWEWAGGGAEWQGKGMAQLQTWDNFELKMCELLLEQRPVMVGYYHKSHVQWLVLQKNSIRRFVITEKAPTRAFSWLRAATTAFTVGAFSVITNLRMELFEALDITDSLTLVQLHRGHVHLPCFSLK